MIPRAESSVFLPGITQAITAVFGLVMIATVVLPSTPTPRQFTRLTQSIPFSASALTTSITKDMVT